MSDEVLTTEAWYEKVLYWECPKCGDTNDVNGVWVKEFEEECSACGCVFRVTEPIEGR